MFKGKLGLLKTKQQLKCGKFLSYALATVHLPPAALEAVGIAVGDKYVVKRLDDRLFTIKKSRNAQCRQLTEAVAIKFTATHKLEFAGNLCAIAAQDMPLTDVDFTIEDDALIFSLPDAVKITATQATQIARYEERERRKEEKSDIGWKEVIAGKTGAAAAVALDSYRYASKEMPVYMSQLEDLLREEGHRLSRINERLFMLDGKSATSADLLQLAQKYQKGLVLVTV